MKEPRFVVTTSNGYAGQRLVTEVMVLDRAYCHRVVWSSLTSLMDVEWRSRRFSRAGNRIKDAVRHERSTARYWPLAKRRAYAEAKAAELNAWDATL